MLHLLLIALTTYQALRIVEREDKHTRIQEAVFSSIYLQDGDGSSSFPYYSLTDFSEAFFSVVEQTQTLDDTLLQYSDIGNTTFRLEVFYSEVTEENKGKMVVVGDSDSFEDNLETELAISQ